MFRIDNTTAVAAPPTPKPAGTPGYFTNGDPVGGVPATVVEADFLNAIQEELLAILSDAGIEPDKTKFTQIRDALRLTSGGVIGMTRNLRASLAAAGSSIAFVADEVVVGNDSGARLKLRSFNKTINLATVGANGMDVGQAPANGAVAIYAIYNPITGASALLGKDASIAVQPEMYSGANMPSGYTTSALISVWMTDASRQLVPGCQIDREVSIRAVTQLNAAGITSPTALTMTAPLNAKSVSGFLQATTTSSQQPQIVVAAEAATTGMQAVSGYTPSGTQSIYGNFRLNLMTPRTLYWNTNSTGFTAIIGLSGYRF